MVFSVSAVAASAAPSAMPSPIPLTVVEVPKGSSPVIHRGQVSSNKGESISATLNPRMLPVLKEDLNADTYEFWYYLAAFKNRWCKNPEKFQVSVEVRDMKVWEKLEGGAIWDPEDKGEAWAITGISFEGCQM